MKPLKKIMRNVMSWTKTLKFNFLFTLRLLSIFDTVRRTGLEKLSDREVCAPTLMTIVVKAYMSTT